MIENNEFRLKLLQNTVINTQIFVYLRKRKSAFLFHVYFQKTKQMSPMYRDFKK